MSEQPPTATPGATGEPPQPRKPLPLSRKLLFIVVLCGLALLVVEVVARIVYFQVNASRTTAIEVIADELNKVRREREIEEARQLASEIGGLHDALFSPEGATVLAEFKARYEEWFDKLVAAVRENESKLLVLYIPSREDPDDLIGASSRRYFAQIANDRKVDVLDVSDVMAEHGLRETTLRPVNGHLSRYGNLVVARAITSWLEPHSGYRNPSAGKPADSALLGALAPSTDDIWSMDYEMPYRAKTTSTGLRGSAEVGTGPRSHQRILALGDSFTFGPYLPDHDTWPALLAGEREGLEVLNAGVAGYTIYDEAQLFIDRSRHAYPDVTVIQVLDNDLTGMFAYKLNRFGYKRWHAEPSAAEAELLERVRARNRAAAATE